MMGHEKESRVIGRQTNRLITEKSPYLLQHAHNPVDWYPWCNEAFDRAHKENKPIFLSIGYSTCHWCHVMEKESFEDPQVARLMNESFISIKVDREERQDLDHIYMTVCQILTGSGGWPLTLIMTPDKRPFFAATYIPKETRFGRPGMMDLIPRIMELWATRHDEIIASADKILVALKSMEIVSLGEKPDSSVLQTAFMQLAQRYDEQRGGFSNAPKFPTPHNLFFLLRYWRRTGTQKALDMVKKTLDEMRKGGIYDHIGFGFHRYATDQNWLLPHFEKMLYDQALLSMAYIEAYQATEKQEYKRTAEEIFRYVLRDMTSPEGGFFSAEDADSEGEEGKYYLWREDEVRKILQREEADLFVKAFNVERNGNFLEEASGRKTGANILHLKKSSAELASDLRMPEKDFLDWLESIRQRLFIVRESRIHPHKDDKILTDWNGLMIAALAKGAQALGDPTYAQAARQGADFILHHLRRPDGRLLHRYRKGEAGVTANADDYAFLIWGLLELYETTFDSFYLATAIQLNEDMLRYFWDERLGGFFFTPEDGEGLILRKKEMNDGALPSGNAVAMLNLLRLSRFTGHIHLEEKASRISQVFSRELTQFPSGYTQFMVSLDFCLGPSHEIIIVGNRETTDTKEMVRTLQTRFIPNKVMILRPTGKESDPIDRLAASIRHHESIDGKATAYVCKNTTCHRPTTDIHEILALVN
ncbi:MAG: thioredoxin domain-containing protein [Pseudomonadota bacterium]